MTLVDDRLSTTHTDTTTQSPQPDVSKPTHRMVIDAIVAEMAAAGKPCSRTSAKKALFRINELAAVAKQHNVAHLGSVDIRTVHEIMDVIMVDHPMFEPISAAAVPAAGSAHDLINRWSPVVKGNVVGIVHTKDRDRGNVYCAVALQLCTVG